MIEAEGEDEEEGSDGLMLILRLGSDVAAVLT